MASQKPNPVREKSYSFALQVVSFCRYLIEDKKEYILSKQLMKSGTSIGANIEEGVNAPTKKDFINKLSISLKEAFETRYWLYLLRDSKYVSEREVIILVDEVQELIALLTSIIRSSRSNMPNE